MIKKILLAFAGLVTVVLIIGGVYALMIQRLIAGGPPQMPPTAVTTMESQRVEWETILSAVGSFKAVQGAVISAEADGVVREINFAPGTKVEAGALLAKLDTDVEEAQLRAAEASAELARVSFKRTQDLFDSATISQAELDQAQAAVRQTEAQADNIRALIARKQVRAPFTGQLGIREISPGQYLNRGAPIVSLQTLDPIYVEFSLPQQELSHLSDGLRVNVTVDAFPGQTFTGEITALNPQIDPVSRNLRIQATLANADGRLRPGMFASVNLVLAEKRSVVIVPQTAVLHSTYGSSVVLAQPGPAGPDGSTSLVAERRPVRTGVTRGDFVEITTGLEGGERVVTSGAFKLRDGVALFESPVGSTPPSLNPNAPNS